MLRTAGGGIAMALDGRVALVTGAARGIGEAIARRPAAGGAEAALGPVDALVNNAGISRLARSEELPREWWDEVLDVNLSGTWRCSQVIGSRMSRGATEP